MPDQTLDDDKTVVPPVTPPVVPPVEIPADVLQAAVDAALAPMKEKLNDAYAKRDAALAKTAEQEQALKEAERTRLREQGLEAEALKSELDELKVSDGVKDKKIVELTRNMEVNSLLSGLEFRNDKSRKMAFEEIVGELVQDENGVWKHKTGTALTSFVTTFAQDDDNSFLFKSKESSGAGTATIKPSSPSGKPESYYSLSQEEMIQRAKAGTLRKK